MHDAVYFHYSILLYKHIIKIDYEQNPGYVVFAYKPLHVIYSKT